MFAATGPFSGESVSDASPLVTGLQLLSHIFFVFAVAYNVWRKHWYLAVNGGITTGVSLMYHACRGAIYCFGIMPDLLRRADHVAALNGFGALALHLIQYDLIYGIGSGRPAAAAAVARHLLWVVCLLAVFAWPFALQSAVLLLAYLLVVVAVRYLGDPDTKSVGVPAFVTRWLVLGVVAALLGLGCYFYNSGTRHTDTTADGIVHSTWHVFAGVAYWALSAAIDDGAL
jgi:hypothetical protein